MGPSDAPGDVTRLLHSWSHGDQHALEQLVPQVYRELRRLAALHLRRERSDHTLQPTALVHEAYLRMVDQTSPHTANRAHFFAIAASLMRQILVNHARHRSAAKRGAGKKVPLDEAAIGARRAPDLVALDDALHLLAERDPRQSQVVELRFFGGLTEEEIADVLGVSVITVKRDWRVARAMLHNELRG